MATTIPPFDPKDVAAHPREFFRREYVWELPVRITHWASGLTLMVLFLTGIYIAHPVLAPSGEAYRHFVMGRVRQVHFASAMIFMVSFFVRIYWFWVGNNYARSGFPFVWRPRWWADLFRQAKDYLKLERGHVHLGHNSLGGLFYTLFVVMLGWAQIITGLALYSESHPGGFLDHLVGWVIPILGGSFGVRLLHHLFAWGFPIFILLHVYIILYDSAQYGNGLITSIVSGYKFYTEGDFKDDRWVS